MTEQDQPSNAVVIGRYLLHRQIARGGMATIHIARLMGDEGFSRIVAAKRLLPEFAEDSEFVEMFLDEARIASKVHHRNVVPVLDVVTTGEEVILVQEYVHGVPLHALLRTARQAKTHVPLNVAVSIACQVLAGLQAAHDTTDEVGAPLNIVHRDVSPQNVMVATDGTARLLDFGVAKASMAAHTTRDGSFKGKVAYSSPEQLKGMATAQSDVYSLSVVLWELVVGHRMHNSAQPEGELLAQILDGKLPTITEALASERESIGKKKWEQLEALEKLIKKGLHVDRAMRFESAETMERAITAAVPPASTADVAAWLKALGKEFLESRDKVLALEEASWRKTASPVSRRTPVPGTLRAMTLLAEEPEVPPLMPPAPSKRTNMAWIIALLAVLVVGLGAFVLVLVKRGSGDAEGASEVTPSNGVNAGNANNTNRTESTTSTNTSVEGTGTTASDTNVQNAVKTAPVTNTDTTTGRTNNDSRPDTITVGKTAPSPETTTVVKTAPSTTTTKTGPKTTGGATGPKTTVGAARTTPVATGRTNAGTGTARTNPTPRTGTTTPDPGTTNTTPDPVVKPPETAKEPKADCTPPYYFDGAKKIFKPNCL